MIEKNSTEFEDKIIRENIGLVITQAMHFKPTRVSDIDDYVQVGRVALLNAIRHYNSDKGTFANYAWKCIRREIIKEAKKFKEDIILELSENIPSPESGEKVWEILTEDLTQKELKAVELWLDGRSFSQVGKVMGYSKEWISQLLKSAFKKMRDANV